MSNKGEILLSVKSLVKQVLPDARVMLFGSRAYGKPGDESDWDFLILTSKPVTRKIKNDLHNVLFPISVQIGAFINTLTVQEDEWASNPAYYSLQQTMAKGMMQI